MRSLFSLALATALAVIAATPSTAQAQVFRNRWVGYSYYYPAYSYYTPGYSSYYYTPSSVYYTTPSYYTPYYSGYYSGYTTPVPAYYYYVR